MAASAPNNQNMCLMCLDSPAVRKVGTCQHTYCDQCLSSHIEGQLRGKPGEVFPCPACRTQGQLRAQVSGDKEYGADNIQLVGDVEQLPQKVTYFAGRDQKASLVNADCKLCYYRGTKVEAVNVCEECKKLLLCASCTKAHREKKLTQNHVVTSLAFVLEREEALCDAHGDPLELFCVTCAKNVCHVCISLDHSEHEVEAFSDVVHTKVEKVRSALEYEEQMLAALKADERELQQSKATAEDMESVILLAIEDHAEKCIEQILTNKDALKKQVRGDFVLIGELKAHIGTVTERIKESNEVVAAAREVLDDQAELHSRYVVKLAKAEEQLDKLKEGTECYEKEKKTLLRDCEFLQQKDIQFSPSIKPDLNIGRLTPSLITDTVEPLTSSPRPVVLIQPNFQPVRVCRPTVGDFNDGAGVGVRDVEDDRISPHLLEVEVSSTPAEFFRMKAQAEPYFDLDVTIEPTGEFIQVVADERDVIDLDDLPSLVGLEVSPMPKTAEQEFLPFHPRPMKAQAEPYSDLDVTIPTIEVASPYQFQNWKKF